MSKKRQDYFLQLYEPVHSNFERFCRARVYGQMDYKDLMNETLMVAYEKINELNNPSAFFSFLCGVSIRILSNQKRKINEIQLNEEIKNTAQSSTVIELEADLYFLYQGLATLSEDQKECVVLFEIAGFSIKEIAKMQKASEDAVKQRLKRGRDKLIIYMNQDAAVAIKKGGKNE